MKGRKKRVLIETKLLKSKISRIAKLSTALAASNLHRTSKRASDRVLIAKRWYGLRVVMI